MDSISLKMPVTVKAKLTEKLKEKILKELEDNLAHVDLELQQLSIQEKRVLQENTPAEPTPESMHRAQAIEAQFGSSLSRRALCLTSRLTLTLPPRADRLRWSL